MTALRIATSAILGLMLFAALVFVPAGTLRYWQAWVFLAVFAVCTLGPSIHLAVHYPAALDRRMKVGPTAETRPAQRLIIVGAWLMFVLIVVVSVLDWRMGWSSVPVWAVIVGDVLVAAGLLSTQLVVVQNNYAGASIRIEEGQPLVSTGLYSVVRHPMYSAALVMTVGIPPALGSWWGLLVVAATFPPVFVARILDEERALTAELAGYPQYRARVRYRLVPGVW